MQDWSPGPPAAGSRRSARRRPARPGRPGRRDGARSWSGRRPGSGSASCPTACWPGLAAVGQPGRPPWSGSPPAWWAHCGGPTARRSGPRCSGGHAAAAEGPTDPVLHRHDPADPQRPAGAAGLGDAGLLVGEEGGEPSQRRVVAVAQQGHRHRVDIVTRARAQGAAEGDGRRRRTGRPRRCPGAGVGRAGRARWAGPATQVAPPARPVAVAVTGTSGPGRGRLVGTALAACWSCGPVADPAVDGHADVQVGRRPGRDPTARARENQGAAGVTHCVWDANVRAGPAAVGETAAAVGETAAPAGSTPGAAGPGSEAAERASVQRATGIRRIDTGRGYAAQ